jgi:FKBP-type peptidyl-prolyl cis-trans isomerase
MRKILGQPFIVGLAAVLSLSSCEKKEYQTISELDEQNIQQYIRQNNLDVEPLGTTGMYYEILEEGTGRELAYDQTIPLVYSFKTLDGSYSSADTFSVSNRYADFLGYFPYGSAVANNNSGSPLDKEEGMKVALNKALQQANGKIRILVPSRLAYGRNGSGSIGSNQSLDYTIRAIDPDDLPDYEDQSIQQYLGKTGVPASSFLKTESGIYYHILEAGSGIQISPEARLKVGYTLRALNGNVLEQSATDSTSMNLATTIAGWKEILPKLKEGGKVRMVIPSSQAYGLKGNISTSAGVNSIPPFSALDFEVSVKDAENSIN